MTSKRVLLFYDNLLLELFAELHSTEGNDRDSLYVDNDGFISQLLQQKGSSRVVVALSTPGVILTNWRGNADAIINMFLAGQETGGAWADVLFGDVNPSGRLPITLPNSEGDTIAPCGGDTCNYHEGLNVGYRGLGTKTVAFPFGHGLSYTTFTYAWVKQPTKTGCTSDQVICMTVSVTNTGNRDGSEVVQVYMDYPASAGEPAGQLRQFQKVQIANHTTVTVDLGISQRGLSIWDVSKNDWAVVQGSFVVNVGASSRDSRLRAGFTN